MVSSPSSTTRQTRVSQRNSLLKWIHTGLPLQKIPFGKKVFLCIVKQAKWKYMSTNKKEKSKIKVPSRFKFLIPLACMCYVWLVDCSFPPIHSLVVCLSTWSHSHRFLKVVENYCMCFFSTLRFEWLSAGLAEVESGIVWKSFEFHSDAHCWACLAALSLSKWNLLYRGFQFFSMGYLSPFHSFAKQPNCIKCNAEEKQRTIILHYILKHIL